jgi:membrane-associated phospholipid phosphatase
MQNTFLTAACVTMLCLCARVATAQPVPSDEKPLSKEPEQQQPERELSLPRSSDPGKQPFLRNFAHDEWRMWSSPFRRSSYDTPTVKKYVIPFALISTALIAADRKTIDIMPNTTDQTVWSGRVSQLGAAYTLAGASGAIYLFGKATGNKHARETGWISLEALAHTQLVVFGMKQATNRRRPVTDEARGGFWNGGDSFPSGHAASSFAVATVFAYEYRHHIAVPITAYSLAALISASRVSARRHWASDIFVGGSTGFLIGRYIYKRRHNPDLPGSPTRGSLGGRLIPGMGFCANGPTLSWHL